MIRIIFYASIAFVILLIAASVLIALLQAYLDVRNRPREPMEWCPTHGHFRKKHCLDFMGMTICPRCYHSAILAAQKDEVKK